MIKFILTNKKNQVWGFDLIIAVTLFLIGIIAIYIYAINLSEAQETLDSLFYEGNLISSLILSEGSPSGWTIENVETPGILTKQKINQTKLDNLYSLAQNQENLKKILGTKYEFYFNFTGMEVSSQGTIKGIGNEPIENPENIIKLERFSIYKNKPVKANFYIWN